MITATEESKFSKEYFNINGIRGIFDTLEEALQEFLDILYCDCSEEEEKTFTHEINGKRYIDIEINTVIPHEDSICVNSLIEKMSQEAYDECEEADTYLENVNTTWSEEQLNRVWKEWKIREKIEAPYYKTIKTKKYRVFFKGYELISYKEI